MSKPVFTASMPRGNSRDVTVRITGEDTGDPVDLSAYTDIRFLVKRTLADSDERALITKTLAASQISISSPSTAGIATFTIAATDTPVNLFQRTQAYPCGLRAYGPTGKVDDLIDPVNSTLTVTISSIQATT